MKVDFGECFKNMDGSDATVKVDGKDTPLTLGHTIAEALLAPNQDQEKERGPKMAHCYVLASQVYQEKEVDLSEKDVELIKEMVGKNIAMPLIVGQVFEILGQ